MASKYQSSTETTNFARLCRIVVDINSDLLRDVLDAQIPPPGLTAILQSESHQLLQCLKGHQRQVLYPSGGVFVGTLQDLDFSLLYTLLRNLRGINIPPHNKGWGKEPDITDRSISANIERLRFQRNEAYGHLPSASLPESDFKSRWNLIRQSVLEIEKAALSGDNYVRAVDNLLTMNMDPETEKYYIEELEKLHKEDLEVKDMLKDVKDKQEVMATNITATARDVKDLKEIHPDLKPMIEKMKTMIKEEKEKKFYPTKGFRDAKEKLLQNKVVVIKGNTGDGKTAIAVQLLHWLSQEQQAGQPLQIHNMEKLDLLAPNSKLITFIDDIFGEKDVCKKDEIEWKKRTLDVKRLFVNVEANNFLVVTIRNEILNSLKKGSPEAIFTENNIIDLSLDTYKVEEEKRGLLNLYKPAKMSWTEKEIINILTCAPNIGFPQCCQLFYQSPNLQKERSRFFEKPFHFLNEALSKLPERSALLYLFLNDGFVRVKDLDPNGQKVNKKKLEEAFDIKLFPGKYDSSKLTYKEKVSFVKESLEKLSGFLVNMEKDLFYNEDLVMTGKHWSHENVYKFEDVYKFHHDSIYVAVAFLYGNATPVGYIQNSPRKCLNYLTTSETATNMIVISSHHYTDMCERLLREFEFGEWDDASVGSLDVWKDPVFVERFVSFLNERKVDKLAVLNEACKSSAEECAFYLLSKGVKPNKCTNLWSLVSSRHENDTNKQLSLLKKVVVYLNNKRKVAVLNEACWSGAEDCALYLLSEGVKPNKETDLFSLVISKLRHWNDGNKQLCLLRKFVVYLNNKRKLAVLNEACWSGAEECALYLLSKGVKPDVDTALSLISSRHWNDGHTQLCLLKQIVVYLDDKRKLAVLNEACKSGAEECALYLLSKGVKPDVDIALSLISSRHWNDGHKQLCLLKKIVVYFNDKIKLAVLNKACKSGTEECALYLLCEEAVKPDEDTVFGVVERGSIKLLRKILECDVTPTARDSISNNVLHEACVWGREEMVTLLCNTYPHLVHDTDWLGQTPLHRVAREGSLGLFQTVERCVSNFFYRVENQQTKCESVDGCVVHKYCACAQYMLQLVDRRGRTVLHHSCGRRGGVFSDCFGKVNREICLHLCRSYPGLIPIVDKEGQHCLHHIAENTSDVDVFTECETYVKQYVESTGGKYDVTTILDNAGKSVLDLAKYRAMIWGSKNNPLLAHLVKVFSK